MNQKILAISAATVCLLSSTAQAQNDTSAENRARNAAWTNCLKAKSLDLSRGTDSAIVVAQGVELTCGKDLQAMIDPMRGDELQDETKWLFFQKKMRETLGEVGRKIALQEVLKARANQSNAPTPSD